MKKLVLARNKLITLPDAIHLTELQVLDLKVSDANFRGNHTKTLLNRDESALLEEYISYRTKNIIAKDMIYNRKWFDN